MSKIIKLRRGGSWISRSWCGESSAYRGNFSPDECSGCAGFRVCCVRPQTIQTENTDQLSLLRGGSWHFSPRDCRSAFRAYDSPDSRINAIGFRVCCVKTQKPKTQKIETLLRGGSWYADPRSCRSAYRYLNSPDIRDDSICFRVCCVKTQKPKTQKIETLLRGGSWYNFPRFCRSAYRFSFSLVIRLNSIGFRVCCTKQKAKQQRVRPFLLFVELLAKFALNKKKQQNKSKCGLLDDIVDQVEGLSPEEDARITLRVIAWRLRERHGHSDTADWLEFEANNK